MVFMNEWWVEKRGLAYGIWFTAGNVSGLFWPFIVQNLLDKHGFRVTLRILALAMLLIAGPAVFVMRPRPRRVAFTSSTKPRLFPSLLPHHLLRDKHFYLFSAAVVLQALVYIIPNLFLPSFADSLDLPKSAGSVLLAAMNFSTIGGQMAFGYVSDRYHPYTLISLSTAMCSIGAFWVLSGTNFTRLTTFSALWGFFASSYDVLFARISTVLTTDPEDALMLYGFVSFERGVSILLEGSFTVALVGEEEGFGKYHGLLRMCAWCMLASALCGIGYFRK